MRVLLTSHFRLDIVPSGRFVSSLANRLQALGHHVRVLAASEFDDFATSLTEHELASSRETLRKAFDAEVDAFDPHIVHAQHVWLLAHMALEAGVPYVLTAWGEELAAAETDPRYRQLAQEAAENAGRIFVGSPKLRDEVHRVFGELDHHVVVACPEAETTAACADTLVAAYREVLVARFGTDIRP
jgi:hypothetical protein